VNIQLCTWFEKTNEIAYKHKAWLESLVEYGEFLKDLRHRLATRQIRVVIIKKDGEELKAIDINPTLIDSTQWQKGSYIIIDSEKCPDDITGTVEPFLKKTKSGEFGSTIGISLEGGKSIKIPLKDILKINISDAEEV